MVKFLPLFLLPTLAWADDVVAPSDFLNQIFQAVGQFGGLPWAGKIAIIIALIVTSMKVDAIRHLIWDRLGALQPLMAPALGLIGGIISMAIGGSFSWPGLAAYVFAGAGAIALHEIMGVLEALPWVGAKYVAMVDSFMGFLGPKKQ